MTIIKFCFQDPLKEQEAEMTMDYVEVFSNVKID